MNIQTITALMAQAPAQPKADQTQFYLMIGMMVSIFVLFYFIIHMPQKREQQRQQQIRDAIKKGDKVITIGGIHGSVAGVDTTNNTVSVQVDRNVKIDFARNAIATVIAKDEKEG